MNLASSSWGTDGKWDGKEVPEHADGDNCDAEENKKALSEAYKKKEEDVAETMPLVGCTWAAENPLPTIVEKMEEMFSDLGLVRQWSWS